MVFDAGHGKSSLAIAKSVFFQQNRFKNPHFQEVWPPGGSAGSPPRKRGPTPPSGFPLSREDRGWRDSSAFDPDQQARDALNLAEARICHPHHERRAFRPIGGRGSAESFLGFLTGYIATQPITISAADPNSSLQPTRVGQALPLHLVRGTPFITPTAYASAPVCGKEGHVTFGLPVGRKVRGMAQGLL
jgi:hypothetical protein